jgi:hypothetical protein
VKTKTWKQLKAIAKRQGTPLDMTAIDHSKGVVELFAVSCDESSKKDRIQRLCIEIALKERAQLWLVVLEELRNPKSILSEASSRTAIRGASTKPPAALPHTATRGSTNAPTRGATKP